MLLKHVLFFAALLPGPLAAAESLTREQLDLSLEAPVLDTKPGPEYFDEARNAGMIIGMDRTPGGRIWGCWTGNGDSANDYFILASSDDDGHSWSKPRLVINPTDPPDTPQRRTLVGNLWSDPAGRLWLFFDQSLGYFDGRCGDWFIRCDNPDAAEPVWTKPVRFADGCTLNKPTVLKNGDWLLPVSLWTRDRIGPAILKDAHHDLDAIRMANVFASSDHGKTWTRRGGVAFPGTDFDEHMIVELRDGQLWMLARTKDGISESYSADNGATWSAPQPSAIKNINARFFIRRLASGRLLLVKNGAIDQRPQRRSHMSAFLSDDDGKTWRGNLLLDERAQVSYPDGFEAPDGMIHILYDWNRHSDAEILMAKFREEDVLAGAFKTPGATPRILVNKALGPRPAPKNIALPVVDLSNDVARRVVVAQGTESTYQGHPTTLLLPDGKTIFAVWTNGHGGTCGPMKRSDDGGKSWSELLPVPDNWTQARNCPALYRLSDGQGTTRLFVFAGQGPDGLMQQAHSTDNGQSWTPMQSTGLKCIMPFCTIVPVEGGKKLIGLTNIRRPGENVDKTSNIVTQSESLDGGLTWSAWRVVCDMGDLKPCEPEIVRSPDGKQLLCLMRENTRVINGLFMVSNDEGKTWSEAKPLPQGLQGDRHKACYAPDGRLVVCFRDTGKNSPTRDHFVAWVGRYEDFVKGREGDYKIKLLHSFAGGDCGYSGLELLPNGTFVATTYIKYRPGTEKQSVVSTRFTLAETDKTVKQPMLWEKQAQEDAKLDRTAISYDGFSPNKMVCDTTLRELPDGSWALFLLAGDDFEPSPKNYIGLTRSNDQGKKWSPLEKVETTFPHEGKTSGQGATELMVHGNRCTLFFSTHSQTWGRDWQSWTMHSDDSCRTWSKPAPVPGRLASFTFVRNHIVTCDGRLMLPFQHYNGPGPNVPPPAPEDKPWHKALAHYVSNPRNGVLISSDGGKTWSEHGDVRLTTDESYHGWAENNIVELGDGRIAMIIRADRLGGVLYYAESKDGGVTWPEFASKTEIPNPGSKATLYPLGGDAVAMLHNPDPARRSPLSLWISFDGMKTWPYRRVLVPESVDGPNGRLNYPDGFVSKDKQWLHFAFDDNRHHAVYYAAKLPPLP